MTYPCRVVQSEDRLVVGVKAEVTLETMFQQVPVMAQKLMPRLGEIENRIGNYTFSIQDYQGMYFETLSPQTPFIKWIGVEVTDFNQVPEGMSTLNLKGGAYLQIDYKGSLAEFPRLWEFILKEWLPQSPYQLDQRAHFEILPASYSPKNSINEEEVWVPLVLS